MRWFPLAALSLCALLGACAEAPASLIANAGPMVPAGVPDRPPASFVGTCGRLPQLCGLPRQDTDTAPADVGSLDRAGAADINTTTRLASQVLAATFHAEEPNALHLAIAISLDPASPTQTATDAAFDDAAALKLLQSVNSAVNGLMARDTGLLANLADDWSPAVGTPNGMVGDCKSFAAEKRRRLLAAGFPADRLFYAVVFRADIGLHALLMAHLDKGDYALDSRQPWVTPWYQAAYTYVQRQALGDQMHWTNLVVTQAPVAPILLAQNRSPAAISGAGSR